MEELRQILEEDLSESLYQIIISNCKGTGTASKVKIRPIMQKQKLLFQSSSYVGTKVLHANYEKADMIEEILRLLQEEFKQMEMTTTAFHTVALISKKGKITCKRKKENTNAPKMAVDLSHNRKKQYLLEEGKAVPFLIDLGIQTQEGKIVKSKYDKFRQINRYLEFIEDIVPSIEHEGTVTILDFGCGKAYLTFAMYYYLSVIKKLDIQMIGLDLKKDVIDYCNKLSHKYGYTGLTFLQGDIGKYQGMTEVDMVVSLHACDLATDYALEKAVQWNAKVIFAVPCCQHEVNRQIKSELLDSVFQYGIIKERMSALITDAVRANMLEKNGYDTQILEFIDMEHTPKNLLIRAIKTNKMRRTSKKTDMERLFEELHVEPTITKLL